jgi:hypothetical protein
LQRIIVGQARHVAAASEPKNRAGRVSFNSSAEVRRMRAPSRIVRSFEAEPSWNTFKAGRNYRFDWPAPAPVTAKY